MTYSVYKTMGLYTRGFINGVIIKLRTACVNKRGEGGRRAAAYIRGFTVVKSPDVGMLFLILHSKIEHSTGISTSCVRYLLHH